MLVLQSFKCKILLIIFVFALVACYNLHLSSDSIHTKERQGLGELTSEKSDDEKQQILEVLEKATAQDRTVIVTAVNHAWAAEGSILDLFLESFRIGEGTERLLDHLLIVAMDQKALERCNSIHPHCYFLATPGVDFAPEQPFMTPDFLKLVWRKNEFLQVVLELGYNFIFTDPDIMWLRNPLPHLNGIDEIIIASDYYMGEPMDKRNWASAGLKFVKSDESTIDFYKLWRMVRTLYPNESDQTTFEIIKHTFYVNLRIRHVDTLYFGGFCQLSRDMNKICTVHANCCVDLQSKLHDLRLVLDDWKNYTRASSEQKESLLNSSLSPWRAPSKCSI